MTRPRIAVLATDEALTTELASVWKRLAPVELVPCASARDLLHVLDRERFDGVIVHAEASAEDGSPVWSLVARAHPALPVVRWGDREPISVADGRSAPLVAIDSNEALDQFLTSEIVSVARGRLSGVSLPSVLQVLHMEQRTCRLRVRTGRTIGELFVRSGALINASLKKLEGQEAALEMLAWTDADVVFDRLPMTIEPVIDSALDFLLIEAARLKDERAFAGLEVPQETETSSGSTSTWLVPAVLRGDADALAAQVIELPGAVVCAVVDLENRVLVASRSTTEAVPRMHNAVADLMSAVKALAEELQLSTQTDDVLLTVGTAYVIVRPLRAVPLFVVAASFRKDTSSLGLLRAQLTRLSNDFGAASSAR